VINTKKETIKVIGVMSGTSLDGLDVAYCHFTFDAEKWHFQLLKAETIEYSTDWLDRLKNATQLATPNFIQLHKEYGYYLGEQINDFVNRNNLLVDFIASHGHTVFHEPEKNKTFQIGDGNYIASKCKLPVISDFRTMDIAYNGQGAPLVPIGDELLFSDYDFCLNLGGFSNISYKKGNKRIAFDICPCNLVLNLLANKLGFDYDKNGELAKNGTINEELLKQLNTLDFYKQQYPKSLGTEWLEENITPILKKSKINAEDKLATFVEHIAYQVGESINSEVTSKNRKLLITGGGALNSYLVNRIIEHCNCTVVIPKKEIIDFKEAIIFAFLGVLRFKKLPNCLSTVTGANKDVIGGTIVWY
jgi:anhydro-N-acetylmuramic acid kinase